jgi:hypothetical protein
MSWIFTFAFLFQINTQSISLPLLQSELIEGVNVSYQFAKSIDLTAKLIEFSDVSLVQVYYQTETGAKLESQVSITPEGNLFCHIDLTNSPYKVFDRIFYWFDITYTNGEKVSTPSYWFDYLDNRFDWQKSESKWFTLYTIPTSSISADEIQSIALAGLKQATGILPVSPDLPMILYVYPDVDSLSSALGLTHSEWAAGEARPEIGVIMVSESENGDSREELQRQIPHELMHILEFAIAGDGYSTAPKWLLEGLATLAENNQTVSDLRTLQKADLEGSLLFMNEICTTFPPQYSQSSLAYLESASFVNYLQKEYGKDSLIELLQNSASYTDCDQLIQSTYGKDLSYLETDWLTTIISPQMLNRSKKEYWFLLLIVPLVFISLAVIKRHGSNDNERKHKVE